MKIPLYPRRGMAVEEWMKSACDWFRANTIRSVVNGRLIRSAGGISIVCNPVSTPSRPGAAGICRFGEVIDIPEDDPGYTQAIRGGVFYCGDKNFNVPDKPILTSTPSDKLIYLKLLTVDPNTDDDDEIFLPGVKTTTATAPTWESLTFTGSEHYPDTTNPASPTGTGTLIVPIGRLIVADGSATLDAVDCGNITATHCAGTLAHTRG